MKSTKVKKIITKEGIYILQVRDIVYVESEGHYLHIHTSKSEIMIRSKIRDFIEDMQEVFLHVHQSFAVNMMYIEKLTKNEILLYNGIKIPVSRAKHKEANGKVLKYIDEKNRAYQK